MARALLGIASLLLSWTALEATFRVVPNHYASLVRPGEEARGEWHRSGQYEWIGSVLQPRRTPNRVTWNSHGWNDVEHAVIKPPGVKRILILGDSFVEAVQVPQRETFFRRMQRDLGPSVELIAMGWSGWGQVQELAALSREGLSYSPDLVLVEFLAGNDVENNHDLLEWIGEHEVVAGSLARRCFVSAERFGLFFTAFACDRIDEIAKRVQGTSDPIDLDVYRSKPLRYMELWKEAWRRTDFAIEVMDRLARQAGSRFAVIAFSSTSEISAWAGSSPRPDLDFRFPTKRMGTFCRNRGIPYLNLSERFATLEKSERERLHIPGDGHWTISGHRRAALEIEKFVADAGLLGPQRRVEDGRGQLPGSR